MASTFTAFTDSDDAGSILKQGFLVKEGVCRACLRAAVAIPFRQDHRAVMAQLKSRRHSSGSRDWLAGGTIKTWKRRYFTLRTAGDHLRFEYTKGIGAEVLGAHAGPRAQSHNIKFKIFKIGK